MATQEQVQIIRALTDELNVTPIDSLISNQQKWGSINFEAARRDLELMFGLSGHLKELPLEILPDGVANTFAQFLTQANSAVQSIKAFSIESGNPTGQRDQLVTQAHQYAEQLLTTTQSWIPFLAYQKGDVQRNIEALSKSVNDAKMILERAKSEATEKSKEIAGIVTAAREASASAGVGVFTSDFDGQASSLETEAVKWLKFTAWLAFLTIVAALLTFLIPIDKEATSAQIVQYMTTKLVVLIVFLTATVWCGRIYKATKHQAAVNNHRANALKTFQAFVKAASGDSIRDAVLLETTRSIFTITPSGYLETTNSSADSSTKVLEIIKGATGSGVK